VNQVSIFVVMSSDCQSLS